MNAEFTAMMEAMMNLPRERFYGFCQMIESQGVPHSEVVNLQIAWELHNNGKFLEYVSEKLEQEGA
jgi:hypothetical protein